MEAESLAKTSSENECAAAMASEYSGSVVVFKVLFETVKPTPTN